MAAGSAETGPETGNETGSVIAAELRLLPTVWSRVAVGTLVVAIVAFPLSTASDFVLSLLNTAGIAAIGAIGLNVLQGYTGQVSLGHSFFVGVGAYAAVGLGVRAGLPLPVWLAGAGAAGALAGLVIGPFALRLRGLHLMILTLGLIPIGRYAFTNWRWLSGGPAGTAAPLALSAGPVDFAAPRFGIMQYDRHQGLFILIWGLVAILLLLVRNLTRTRTGRAMQAIRDAELPARVLGVSPLRTKLAAFAVASALGALAGALTVALLGYVSPEQFNPTLAIQYLVIVVVGGSGTTFGPVVGALVITSIPQLTTRYAESIPLVRPTVGETIGGFGISAGNLSLVLYGALLVVFVLAEPRGLVHLAGRVRRRLTARGSPAS